MQSQRQTFVTGRTEFVWIRRNISSSVAFLFETRLLVAPICNCGLEPGLWSSLTIDKKFMSLAACNLTLELDYLSDRGLCSHINWFLTVVTVAFQELGSRATKRKLSDSPGVSKTTPNSSERTDCLNISHSAVLESIIAALLVVLLLPHISVQVCQYFLIARPNIKSDVLAKVSTGCWNSVPFIGIGSHAGGPADICACWSHTIQLMNPIDLGPVQVQISWARRHRTVRISNFFWFSAYVNVLF